MDHAVPGGVYLCQVNETSSCAACCGLYNLPELSRPCLSALLERRTAKFASLPRKIDELDAFGREESVRLKGPKPYASFHHCPFIGLIGSKRRRVGCLLHPLTAGNHGIDYRGLSYYGGMACRRYFCPATVTLAPALKQILRRLSLDWYTYGLIVTEAALHQALFKRIEGVCSCDRILEKMAHERSVAKWCEQLFTLKLNWPYRHPGKSLCHYLFEAKRFSKPKIKDGRPTESPSPYAEIMDELDSHLRSQKAVKNAENFLSQLLVLPEGLAEI